MIHLPTFEELKQYARSVLCRRADLDLETPILESTLLRKGRPCGIEYVLLGPRSVRLSSIWEADGDRMLFYDHNLERFQVTQVKGPDPAGILDRPREEVTVKSAWKGK